MLRYGLRKLILAIPLLFGVLSLTFALVELAPGDAADRFFTPDTPPELRSMIAEKWALDQPFHERYLRMMGNLLTGDFGRSILQDRPVFDLIAEALPNTLLLSTVTILIMQVGGMALGTVQAVRQNRPADVLISLVTLFLYSMPGFWLALMLQLTFALTFPVLPPSGLHDSVMYDMMGPGAQLVDRLKHLVLPGFAMALGSTAGIARIQRSTMLEVLGQDYIRTARAKGLPERTVVLKHGLRNALLPIITIIGMQLPMLFSGAVLVETIFAWPGMGRLVVQAILGQDTPVIIACFFVFTTLVVLGNLLADLACAAADPRIRLE